MKKPKAVLTSDVHYSLATLELADAAMRQAIALADKLNVRLIDCGDLTNDKALLRGEVVNRLLETFATVRTSTYLIIGNHSLINEKSDENAIMFLDDYKGINWLIRDQMRPAHTGVECFAYHADPEELLAKIKRIPKGTPLILHQGLSSSNAGEYYQDKSAIHPKDVAGRRIIAGHYHTRQTIALPDGGQWDYIGNPYTLNFGEANDPVKGFQVLYDDNSLEFIATNLRKHVIIEATAENFNSCPHTALPGDIVKVKLSGKRSALAIIRRDDIKKALRLPMDNFSLELVYTDVANTPSPIAHSTSNREALRMMIDNHPGLTDEQKSRLKAKSDKY